MGEKDVTEKTLEMYNDVFADIANGFLFRGKEVINQRICVKYWIVQKQEEKHGERPEEKPEESKRGLMRL